MLGTDELNIQVGTWQMLSLDAIAIREHVFINEQQIAAQDEWDEHDACALHFVLYRGKNAIATARLLANHRIGRVAVLKSQRGLGYGRQLMNQVLVTAREVGRPYVALSAQVHALEFYTSLGFYKQGEVYVECGIPHQEMILNFE